MGADLATELRAHIYLYRVTPRRYRATASVEPMTGARREPPESPDHEGHGEGACPAVAIRRAVDDALHDINRWRQQRGLKVLG